MLDPNVLLFPFDAYLFVHGGLDLCNGYIFKALFHFLTGGRWNLAYILTAPYRAFWKKEPPFEDLESPLTFKIALACIFVSLNDIRLISAYNTVFGQELPKSVMAFGLYIIYLLSDLQIRNVIMIRIFRAIYTLQTMYLVEQTARVLLHPLLYYYPRIEHSLFSVVRAIVFLYLLLGLRRFVTQPTKQNGARTAVLPQGTSAT